MPVIAPDFGCAKWKMVNPNYTNVPLDISLGKLSSKKQKREDHMYVKVELCETLGMTINDSLEEK